MQKAWGALIHFLKSPWTRWVGFRYLRSKKDSRFLNLMTLLSLGGVALGVASMIIVLSIMDGFEDTLKKRMMGSDLHILIQPTPQTPGYQDGFVPEDTLPLEMQKTWSQKNAGKILGFWPVLSTEVLLQMGRKVAGVVVKGVPIERLERFKSFGQKVHPAPSLEPVLEHEPPMKGVQAIAEESYTKTSFGLWLGQELAYELGFIPGDSIRWISPTEFEGLLESVPKVKHSFVEGIYHSGFAEQELHIAFIDVKEVRSFLRKKGVVSHWEVTVADFEGAPALAQQIRESVSSLHLQVQDWIQLNSRLFGALKLERFAMFVILTFIIIVASFNIVTTLTLMVLEKKKEISILKTIGSLDEQVGALFLAEGLFIGILGVSGGLVVGFLVCCLLKRYEWITLPEIFFDRTLPVTFNWKYYCFVPVATLLIVWIACLYPARRASQMSPLDGMRSS